MGKSGSKSVNNVGKCGSQRLPFDGKSLCGRPSLSSGAGGALASGASERNEAWTEYVDTSMMSIQENLTKELLEENKDGDNDPTKHEIHSNT